MTNNCMFCYTRSNKRCQTSLLRGCSGNRYKSLKGCEQPRGLEIILVWHMGKI